ncbi:MAG: YabP/YqfC family sporulation protein [Firmicutes bacterium]|nr:YabP/YqfC family sporulation protein [Bacillota bacterium]
MEQLFSNRLLLTERKHLVVDGVEHVGKFTEKEINLDTNLGRLVLRGDFLHITQLNLEEGNLVVEGRVDQLVFTEKTSKGARGKGLMGRILK